MKPNLRATLTHFAQGLLMGGADVIPGVSGGTMALIVGIYERLIDTLSHLFSAVLSALRADMEDVRRHLRAVEWGLLLPLGAGIATAIVLAAGVILHLLEHYPEQMLGLFFGLVAASLAIPWMRIAAPGLRELLVAAVGAVLAFWFTSLPMSATAADPSLARVFGAAAVAICAMILPGVSGAFLLKAIGMYEVTLAALNGFDVLYVAVFCAGAGIGLGLFSKVLDALLSRYHDLTMAALVGLMAGALRALWPWQDAATRTLHWPGPADPLASVLLFFALGFAFIAALTWLSADRLGDEEPVQAKEEPAVTS